MSETDARRERGWTDLALFVASAAYTGRFPVAPGTVGSLVGLVLDLGLRWARSPLLHGLVMVAVVLGGLLSADRVERALGTKDPSVVVVDEVAGMMLSLYLLPLSVFGLAAGFVIFRVLDVLKPFPCRRAESLSGGIGIMADDLIAGVYTNGLLRLSSLWLPALLTAPGG
jgi:phosphatidylglycerophosphatase A